MLSFNAKSMTFPAVRPVFVIAMPAGIPSFSMSAPDTAYRKTVQSEPSMLWSVTTSCSVFVHESSVSGIGISDGLDPPETPVMQGQNRLSGQGSSG